VKYRSRTEIVAMILQSARIGATKTKIMYKAYLSYTQLKEYLKFLQDNNLIKYEEGTSIYRVTEKGRHFLHAYDEISDLVSSKTTGKIVNV
jgi:predicted transcriptional regulator